MKTKCLGKARIIVGRRTEASTNSVIPLKISNDYRFKNRLPKTEKFQGDMMEGQKKPIFQQGEANGSAHVAEKFVLNDRYLPSPLMLLRSG